MLPVDLIAAQENLYKPLGLALHSYAIQNESTEYAAATFMLSHHHILFRHAKITPTKAGQFVTIWKRNGTGPIMPFDMSDPIDFFIIGINEDNRIGQFIFPKQMLLKNGYVSLYGKGGKRAMRVYPPWVHDLNAQAHKTQAWQTPYFFEISKQNPPLIAHLATVFNSK